MARLSTSLKINLSTTHDINPSTSLRVYKKKSSGKQGLKRTWPKISIKPLYSSRDSSPLGEGESRSFRLSSSRYTRTISYYLSLILALALIIFGVALIFWAAYRHGWDFGEGKSANQAVVTQVEAVAKPVKIYIPKLARTLDISDGEIVDGRWKVATGGVSYLTTSGQIGKVGNAVIYGHNTINILGGLWRVQNGDNVQVTANDGKVYKYEIFERKEVKPNQVEILTQTDDARLTIYTCSGFLDSARFVIVGKLVT